MKWVKGRLPLPVLLKLALFIIIVPLKGMHFIIHLGIMDGT